MWVRLPAPHTIVNSIGREERRERERAVFVQVCIHNHCYIQVQVCFHNHCFYENPLQVNIHSNSNNNNNNNNNNKSQNRAGEEKERGERGEGDLPEHERA